MKRKETVIRTFADLERVFGTRSESEKKADTTQPEVGMAGFVTKADYQHHQTAHQPKTAVG